MKLSYTLSEASEATGFSQDTLVKRIRCGDLRAKRSGKNADGDPTGKHIILAADLSRWLEQLADA